MKKLSTLLLLGLMSLNLAAQKMSKDKKAVVASVEKHKENLIKKKPRRSFQTPEGHTINVPVAVELCASLE